MKNLSKNLFRVLVALFLFVAVGLVPASRAEGADVGQKVATLTVSSKLTEDDVAQAIKQALVGRRWIIRDVADGQIVAHYERGKNVATLTIRYDDEKIEVFAVGSSRGGGLPMRWIDGLRQNIEEYLGRALMNH